MERTFTGELQASVRAQARLRMRFGIPVALVMLVAASMHAPAGSTTPFAVVVGFIATYLIYIFGASFCSTRPALLGPRDLVILTAIVDPLMLSAWLWLAGETSMLLVGFYLYTTLGFGFRVGTSAMHLCQVVSLVGFGLVIAASPIWQASPFVALSHVVLLIVVPLYAGGLIKKLHMAKALAEHESRAKTQLLANVSHELRTPLTGIVSSAQLIEVEAKEPAIVDRARLILSLATALDGEIKQLLDMAKVEAGIADTDAIPYDLALAGEHVMRALRPIAAVKNLSVELRVDRRLSRPVLGRPQELISVLMNLAGNAVKFTHHGAVTIAIELVEESARAYRVRFEVKDTGIGIPADMQERIFEPFVQVETGAARRYSGTGLGTTIAREHVKRMGGVLKVESEKGTGSRFWFEVELEILAEQESAVGTTPAAEPVRAGQRVLVADDNALNLTLMREMLAKDGHAVTAVGRGSDAMEALASLEFDLVLLDFNMEDVDGLTVFQAYTFGSLRPAPTYFVTADATEATAARLLAAGAAGVIHKPVTFEKLRAAMRGESPRDVPTPSFLARPTAAGALVRPVPVAYLSEDALDRLREIKDTPEFLHLMLSDGMADISELERQLVQQMRAGQVDQVHHHAHTMRGVALNFGAVRMATLAARLMNITEGVLAHELGRFLAELADVVHGTLAALDTQRQQFRVGETAAVRQAGAPP